MHLRLKRSVAISQKVDHVGGAAAVRNHQIRLTVQFEIGNRNRTCSVIRRLGRGRSKTAIACQQDQHNVTEVGGLRGYNHIKLAVSVHVTHRHRGWIEPGPVIFRRLESAVAVSQKNRHAGVCEVGRE